MLSVPGGGLLVSKRRSDAELARNDQELGKEEGSQGESADHQDSETKNYKAGTLTGSIRKVQDGKEGEAHDNNVVDGKTNVLALLEASIDLPGLEGKESSHEGHDEVQPDQAPEDTLLEQQIGGPALDNTVVWMEIFSDDRLERIYRCPDGKNDLGCKGGY